MTPTSTAKKAYNKKRYANMDSSSKEKRKKEMQGYRNKRIYGVTGSMVAKDTPIGNEPSHTDIGTTSVERENHITNEQLNGHTFEGKCCICCFLWTLLFIFVSSSNYMRRVMLIYRVSPW